SSPSISAGPALLSLFAKTFTAVLAFGKSRLELAPDLVKSDGGIRRTLPAREHFSYPSGETNARGRAKTVERLYRELKKFPPKLGDAEYRKLRTAHPGSLAIYIAEKWPDEAKPFLMRQPNRRKQGLQTAMQ